jgi:S-adenosylmethionine:tRNA ribosyltransferase-isomerase
LLDQYDYSVPPSLIAEEPAEPRDSARLFVYDTQADTITHAHVRDLPHFIPGALMVLNNTAVVPARVIATQTTGQPIEVFFLVNQLSDRADRVPVLTRGRVRVGEVLSVGSHQFTVLDHEERWVNVSTTLSRDELMRFLDEYGQTPLPPYIHSEQSDAELRARYQTIFAAVPASVAAPTASLHFTPDLLARLRTVGVTEAVVTLHVGLGTFAPVTPEQIAARRLHQEWYEVSPESAALIREAHAGSRPVLAVGTTVVRTLESAATQIAESKPARGSTDLFIMPPHQFTYPTALLTNFHVPRSSLLALVDAFLIHKGARRPVLSLYENALTNQYRLFSFGDAMLIL